MIVPVDAAKAVFSLLKNPDDTSQVFRLIRATGGLPSSLTRMFRKSASGRALLVDKPSILPLLEDTAALGALPNGSLGQAYLSFMENERIAAAGLVAAESVGNPDAPYEDEDERWISERLRDTHDLWHAVTGYQGDLLGESALLGFTFGQTRGAAFGVLASVAFLYADDEDARRLLVDGVARGIGAAWLPAVRWEDLLSAPVQDVRRQLRVGEPRVYKPFRSSELEPTGPFGLGRPREAN